MGTLIHLLSYSTSQSRGSNTVYRTSFSSSLSMAWFLVPDQLILVFQKLNCVKNKQPWVCGRKYLVEERLENNRTGGQEPLFTTAVSPITSQDAQQVKQQNIRSDQRSLEPSFARIPITTLLFMYMHSVGHVAHNGCYTLLSVLYWTVGLVHWVW